MRNPNAFPRKLKVEDSSNLKAICFDPVSLELAIQFQTGDWYLYKDVPKYFFGDLASAESVGTTFQKLLRNNSSVKYEKADT